MHKYVIMGVQGCGKGTQAARLVDAFDLVHISVGDIFRWHIKNHTKLGAQVKRIVSSGNLVGDDVVETIVHRRLDEHDWNYGFILDGFPRSESQALFFLETYDIDAVIHIEVPDEVVRQRVLSRRLCSGCGLDYNLISHRPAVEDVCDVCGSGLRARPDDTEEALAGRLRDYHTKTKPVLSLFERKELVLDIDGTAKPDAIHQEIRTRLGC
ncbi:nucleoside monophosphate kinase [Stieleria sp.]|uniref:Adenylate kinase n=1 Tax=Stieleria magnilauensis TaxID=2527963 RepID=A0ABX5XS03_9BACT|nr:nucleoside monophosphate kinase [Phycisphaera sp. RhM]QDV82674.1 Adenylate kinase [Planctomycetes bacterium TBK1r]